MAHNWCQYVIHVVSAWHRKSARQALKLNGFCSWHYECQFGM